MDAAQNATKFAVSAEGGLPAAAAYAPAAQAVVQAVVVVVMASASASLAYLIVQRRKLERMHGDAWANTSLLVLIGGAQLVLAAFQLVVVTAVPLACALQALLSAATLPVSATVYLARAWALIVQFARVSEQTRWFQIYQMPAKERDELKGRRPPLPVRINASLAKYKAAAAPPVLLVAALLVGAATWLPLAWARYEAACTQHPDPVAANAIPVAVAVAVSLLWWQFKGRDDSRKQKRELVVVTIGLVLVQALRCSGGLVQHAVVEAGAARPFLFWYDAGLNAAQLALQVGISLVFPSARLWRFRDGHISQSHANNQRLVEILASTRYKQEFRLFLEKQFSQENLIFYDLCKDVSAKARNNLPFMDPDLIFEIQDSIHAIHNDFVSDSSKFQVNLPNGIRMEILNSVKAMRSVEMFTIETQVQNIQACVAALDQAAASVFGLLASDTLPRFLQHRKDKRKHRHSTSGFRHKLGSYSRPHRDTFFSKEGKSGSELKAGSLGESPRSPPTL